MTARQVCNSSPAVAPRLPGLVGRGGVLCRFRADGRSGHARWADLATITTSPPATVAVPTTRCDDPGVALEDRARHASQALARAAALVPLAAGRLVVSADLTGLLLAAVADLAPDASAPRRRELVDQARERLASYLVVAGQAEPGLRVGVVLHGWVLGRTSTELQRALMSAARPDAATRADPDGPTIDIADH